MSGTSSMWTPGPQAIFAPLFALACPISIMTSSGVE